MTHEIVAIYDHGVLRPLEPLVLPDGARVHLHIEQDVASNDSPASAQMRSPHLANPEQVHEFTMEVRELS